MPELFKQPSSRIAQIDGEHALCEDGSVWVQYENRQAPYMWVLVSPPHNPSTQSADLAEALALLRRLWTYTEPTSEVSEEAYKDVHDFLEKHGA
jgi:hypothetical protein